MDGAGAVRAAVDSHAQVGARHRGLPGRWVVHGRVVHGAAVLARQGLDLLLELLGVEAVVHAPGVAGDGAPGVVRQAGVAVVLEVGLGGQVLHLLKQDNSQACYT